MANDVMGIITAKVMEGNRYMITFFFLLDISDFGSIIQFHALCKMILRNQSLPRFYLKIAISTQGTDIISTYVIVMSYLVVFLRVRIATFIAGYRRVV